MKAMSSLFLFISSLVFAGSTFLFFGTYDPSQFPTPAVQPYFTPAPYTFGIWAVIYLWLGIGTFMQWRKHGHEMAWQEMCWPLIISMLVGAIWPWTFQSSSGIGTLIIVVMLIGAAWSLVRTPITTPWIGIYPIGLYVGWLCAATGVSLTVWLVEAGIMGNMLGSLIGLIVGAALGLVMIWRKPSAITLMVAVVWALVGVIVDNVQNQGPTSFIIFTALGAIVIAVYGVMRFNKFK